MKAVEAPTESALTQWRHRTHLGLTRVARHLGVDYTTVYRWEMGLRVPGVSDALKLAKLYGCQVEDLWGDADEAPGAAVLPPGVPVGVLLEHRAIPDPAMGDWHCSSEGCSVLTVRFPRYEDYLAHLVERSRYA